MTALGESARFLLMAFIVANIIWWLHDAVADRPLDEVVLEGVRSFAW